MSSSDSASASGSSSRTSSRRTSSAFGSQSSTDVVLSSTITTPFATPPLSTPTNDSPFPTFLPPPQGEQNNNNSPGIATSASLYLYTFLATLVLLLGVSSAIVVRSLLLRRRHRRMIEEAIRNGTWIPPASSTRPRVDLSKKPKMWEAWIARGGADPGGGGVTGAGVASGHPLQDGAAAGGKAATREREEPADWDDIKPFSVTYTTPPPAPISAPSEPPTPTRTRVPVGSRAFHAAISSRLARWGLLGRAHRDAHLGTQHGSTTDVVVQMGTRRSSEKAPENAAAEGGDADGRTRRKRPRVQVAVLIAMPVRPTSASPRIANPTSAYVDDEEPLPHLEFGVAEAPIYGGEEDEEDEGLDDGVEGVDGETKAVPKKSMASEGSGGEAGSRDGEPRPHVGGGPADLV